jgi:hypothetical protein
MSSHIRRSYTSGLKSSAIPPGCWDGPSAPDLLGQLSDAIDGGRVTAVASEPVHVDSLCTSSERQLFPRPAVAGGVELGRPGMPPYSSMNARTRSHCACQHSSNLVVGAF